MAFLVLEQQGWVLTAAPLFSVPVGQAFSARALMWKAVAVHPLFMGARALHAAFGRWRVEHHFHLRLLGAGRRSMRAMVRRKQHRQNRNMQTGRDDKRNRRPGLDHRLRPHHGSQDGFYRRRCWNIISQPPPATSRRSARHVWLFRANNKKSWLQTRGLAPDSRVVAHHGVLPWLRRVLWWRVIAGPFVPGRAGLSSGGLGIRVWEWTCGSGIMAAMSGSRKAQTVTEVTKGNKHHVR